MKLGIWATKQQYAEHLLPIWEACSPEERVEFGYLERTDTILTSSAVDFRHLAELGAPQRLIYMEHGVGLQQHKPETIRLMHRAHSVFVPNTFTALELRSMGLRRDIKVVGTPKMDKLLVIPESGLGVIAVSFHWTGRGQNWRRYEQVLRRLRNKHQLIGHGHPYMSEQWRNRWRNIGVEYVQDFAEVVERADYYICDHSSTIYEWAALDRPGLMLDRPHGQDTLLSTGLLYQKHANICARATPSTLAEDIRDMKNTPQLFKATRGEVTRDLYPYLGCSTNRVLELLRMEDHAA